MPGEDVPHAEQRTPNSSTLWTTSAEHGAGHLIVAVGTAGEMAVAWTSVRECHQS